MLKAGDVYQFTYRCWESEESQDAVLWHRTGQQVTIIRELNDVDEFDVGKMYRVEFPDGFHGDAFRDELTHTKGRNSRGSTNRN